MSIKKFDTSEAFSPDYLEGISEVSPFISQPARAAGNIDFSSNAAIDTSSLESLEPEIHTAEIQQYVPNSSVDERNEENNDIVNLATITLTKLGCAVSKFIVCFS